MDPALPNSLIQPSYLAALRKSLAEGTGIVWNAEDAFGGQMLWTEVRATLGGINLESAATCMAYLNVFTAIAAKRGPHVGGLRPDAIQQLVEFLFPLQYQSRALDLYENHSQSFQALAPQACLAASEACLRFCNPTDGIKLSAPSEFAPFAHMILSFHDALFVESEFAEGFTYDALTAPQFSSFTRNYLAANFYYDAVAAETRHYMMFETGEQSGALSLHAGMSAATWFRAASGIDPQTYRLNQIVMAASTMNLDQMGSVGTKIRYHFDDYIKHLESVSADIFRRLHELSVIDPTELTTTAAPLDWTSALYSQNYLRRRQVLPLRDGYFLNIHPQLTFEKFFVTPVHVLADLAQKRFIDGWPQDPSERSLKVRRDMGYVFEDYCRLLIETIFDGYGAKSMFRYDLEGKERDGVLLFGGTALVFEFVHHPWSIEDRATGDVERLLKHIADNVSKAHSASAALAAGTHPIEPKRKMYKVLPIVILSDILPIHEATALTFAKRLVAETSAEAVNGTTSIFPVQLLSVFQFENLDRTIPRNGRAKPFLDFLEKRARSQAKRFSGASFLGLKRLGSVRLKKFENETHASFEKLGPTLFKGE